MPSAVCCYPKINLCIRLICMCCQSTNRPSTILYSVGLTLCRHRWAWSTFLQRRRGECSENATRRASGTGVSLCYPYVLKWMTDWVKSRVLFFTAVPFSVVSMAVTQALVARGNFTLCLYKYAKINASKTDKTFNVVVIMCCLHLQGLFLHLQGLDPSLRWSVSPYTLCSIY